MLMNNFLRTSFILSLLAAVIATSTWIFGSLLLKIQAIPRTIFPDIFYLLPFLCIASFLFLKKYPQFKQGTPSMLQAHAEGDEVTQLRNGFFRWHFLAITLTTWISHIFGASVGRESSALQIGGSLADWAKNVFKSWTMNNFDLRLYGMMMGFASLFGTPLAAVFFVLEISKNWSLKRFFWGLFSAILCRYFFNLYGGQNLHLNFILKTDFKYSIPLLASTLLLGLSTGVLAWFFLRGIFLLKRFQSLQSQFLASLVLILCFAIFNNHDLMGLSLSSLEGSFQTSSPVSFFLQKLIVTLLSSAAGFQGGEVTPLFVIGATMGSSLASLLGQPLDLFAALALVGVFAGVTRSPIGSLMLGLELFGMSPFFLFTLVILISLRIAPRQGLYSLS